MRIAGVQTLLAKIQSQAQQVLVIDDVPPEPSDLDVLAITEKFDLRGAGLRRLAAGFGDQPLRLGKGGGDGGAKLMGGIGGKAPLRLERAPQAGEEFIATVRRLGTEPFKAAFVREVSHEAA